jgi:hypothetical protein
MPLLTLTEQGNKMKTLKQPKILFFTAGPAPSAAERIAAMELGIPVMWRNGAAHTVGEIEPCDGVAGSVPKCYKDKKVKSAKGVIADYQKALKAALAGEEKAPSLEQVADDEEENEQEGETSGKLQNGGQWGG